MIKIKVLTLKRRKVRDSHLAGRDLSIGKKFCTLPPPPPPPPKKKEKNETLFNFTDAAIAWSPDVIVYVRKGAWYCCKFHSVLGDDVF